MALLKTPWDYHRRVEEFRSWLGMLESLNVRLLNSYDTVRWNIDKHYLKDVSAAGFDVIPSVFLKQGWEGDLVALFEELGTDSIIVKPCVSGGSKNTVVVRREDAASASASVGVRELLALGDYIVQPLMNEVQEGEWSHQKKEISDAAAYVERFAKDSLYARVDGLMVEGKFMLMELELIEPFLYLSYGDNAVERYYQALAETLAAS